MKGEDILYRESKNDGQTVHLYYNRQIGMYTAYGLSAFYADHVSSSILSYSDNLQLPVALLNRRDVLGLRQSMTVKEHESFSYYRLMAKEPMGTEGYENWLAKIGKTTFAAKPAEE